MTAGRIVRAIAGVAMLALAGCGSSHRSPALSTPANISPAESSPANTSPAASSPALGPPSTGGSPAGSATGTASPGARPAGPVPRFDHVVVVVEENRSYSEIIGSPAAPYLNSLAAGGALFTRSYGLTHPSQPNYLALFSGSTQGVTGDSCPHSFTGPNLASQLLAAGLGFAGYSESMPSDGYLGCGSDSYARKHNPWSDFSTLPPTVNRTLSSFPSDYAALPTVSFVIPNLDNDMHDGSVPAGDSWLRDHLDGYARWAKAHRSLLVVTWDENDNSPGNHIATIFYGASVKAGRYAERVSHYRLLRTLQVAYGLPALGDSGTASPITDVWQ